MNAIAAADENFGIGYNGKLLYSIPEDMKYFRDMTMGKTVIMGYATLMSLPNGKPLKNRSNIILTGKDIAIEDAVVCASVEDVLDAVRDIPEDDVFIIGGESVYKQFIQHCRRVYLTKIYSQKPADKFFPDITRLDGWQLKSKSELKFHEDITFDFEEFINDSL